MSLPKHKCGDPAETQEAIPVYHEHGIQITDNYHALRNSSNKPSCNPKLLMCREFTLCTLSVMSQKSGATPIACLDPHGRTGICGMQWKHHFSDSVSVAITDKDSIESVKQNCAANGLNVQPLNLDFDKTLGISLEQQCANEIFLKKCNPHVALHMQSFDFVYLEPHGCCVQYLDSLFTNLKKGGIACVVTMDTASLFGKTGHVTSRNYSCNILKTDYMKEMACRVVSSAIVRAAARCGKGVDILFTVCIEPFVMIAARVQRGPAHADACVQQIKMLLHCRMCEEMVFSTAGLAPLVDPYKLLPCDCQRTTTGQTAVQLGPMWSGDIFNGDFLKQMGSASKSLALSRSFLATLSLITEESLCSRNSLNPDSNTCITTNITASKSDIHCNERDCISHKNFENVNETDTSLETNVEDKSTFKRQLQDIEPISEVAVKRQKLENGGGCSIPFFYYNMHRQKFKYVKLPRAPKIVKLLQQEGYQASRTHFDTHAIRTSANSKELLHILKVYSTNS